MNKVTKIEKQEILDREPFLDDSEIRKLNSARTASEYVTAFSSAWKKNRWMYLYLGKKMNDLRESNNEVWIEVRKELQKTINNGTISAMLSVGENYDWFTQHIDYLPNSLVGLKKLADVSNEKKREQAVLRLKENFQNDKREATEKDVDNALGNKTVKANKTTSSSKKQPTVVAIQMSYDNYQQNGHELIEQLEKIRKKFGLTTRSMIINAKPLKDEE
jgi:hypothetical protein